MEDARKKYADIIDLPHPTSARHAPMDRLARAAQFSPFAALTGYDDLIAEAGRATEAAPIPDEAAIEELNSKLTLLRSRLAERPAVTLLCFRPDEKKAGGAFFTLEGALTAIDAQRGTLTIAGCPPVPLDCIADLRSALFSEST